MRIIAGAYSGRILSTVRDTRVRPATDKVKGSIFNSLQNRLGLSNALVLDLFAGSGSLGFEAISRGARSVVFVEQDRDILKTIIANADTLECSDQCEVIESDVVEFIERARGQYDLIFADPPYAYERTEHLPTMIIRKGLLKKEGFLIIEHSRKTIFEKSQEFYRAVNKTFGNTQISWFACGREEKK